MADREDDFEDLVGDGTPDADETKEASKTGVTEDEGADKDADKTAAAEKAPKDGDEGGDDEDEGGEGEKTSPDAKKDGDKDADADKEDAKGKMVPKAALESEKRRRREIAARLKRLEDRQNAEDAEVARRAIPDPKTDAAGHAAYVARQAQAAQVNDRLNFSEYHARRTHGDDVVTEAFEWANARMEDPKNGEQFAVTVLGHADPYDYAVSLYRAEQEAKDGGGAASGDPEFEQFKAWKASQSKDGSAVPPQQEDKKAARPTSLAQRSSAAGPSGGNVVEDPFASEFDR